MENDNQSFYKQGCSTTQCPPNTPTVANPKTALELNAQGKPNYSPAQVVAVTPHFRSDLKHSFPDYARRNAVGILSAHQHTMVWRSGIHAKAAAAWQFGPGNIPGSGNKL